MSTKEYEYLLPSLHTYMIINDIRSLKVFAVIVDILLKRRSLKIYNVSYLKVVS